MSKTKSITHAKEKEAFKAMSKESGFENVMQTPRLVKVVVSIGTGSLKDKKKMDLIVDRLVKICGQKPVIRGAKKSVASFKTRQGDPIGLQTTLRGVRMYGFLDKLLNVALPRTKDFKGVSVKAVDEMGNMTIGIKEHTIFPETSDEDIRDVFGLGITIATTAGNRKDGEAFLRHIGVPFSKSQN